MVERRNEKRTSAPELREYRPVYWLRLILRVSSMLTCALICFSLIDAINIYQKTRSVRNPFHDGSGSFPVWPEREGLKLYPTYVLLGAAIIAGAFSFVLVVASFTKIVSASSARYLSNDADNGLGTKDDKGREHQYDRCVFYMSCVMGRCNSILWYLGYL